MITNREEVIDKAFKVFLKMNYWKWQHLARAIQTIRLPVRLLRHMEKKLREAVCQMRLKLRATEFRFS